MGKETLSKVVYRDGSNKILIIMPLLTHLQDLSTTFFFLVGDANQSDFYVLTKYPVRVVAHQRCHHPLFTRKSDIIILHLATIVNLP